MLEKDVGKILDATFSSSSDGHLKVIMQHFYFHATQSFYLF